MNMAQYIHLSDNEFLKVFTFLVIMNKALIKIGIQVFVWLSVFLNLGKHLTVGLVNHKLSICLPLLEIFKMFSK